MLQNAAQAHQGAKATLSIAESSGAKDHWQQSTCKALTSAAVTILQPMTSLSPLKSKLGLA